MFCLKLTHPRMATSLIKRMNCTNKQTHKSKILFYCLLALLAWLPLPLGSNRPWAWSIFNLASYSIFAVSVYTYRHELLSRLSSYKAAIAIFVSFLVYIFVQTVPLPISVLSVLSTESANVYVTAGVNKAPISIDAPQTLISFYKSIAYFSVFITTLILCDELKKIKLLMLLIISAGLFQAMYGALEILFKVEASWVFQLPVKQNATGTFVYKNHFANFLMLCLSVGVGYLVSTLLSSKPTGGGHQKLRNVLSMFLNGKAFVRIALAIMVIALVMSRSRMGNTAFFLSMTVVGLLSLFLIKRRTKGLTLLIISMFIIDMFILSAWFGLDKVKDRIEQTSLSTETRDEVVIDSIPLLQDFALTGSGLGTYYTAFPQHTGDEVYAFYDHAHNDYLQFAIELGIPATLVIFSLPLIALWQCVKVLKHRKSSIAKGAAFGVLMSIVGMAIHISVDFPLQAPANAAYFVVMLAMGFAVSNRQLK